MSFFQVDDGFHSNPKVMAMLERAGFDRASKAISVWLLSGSLARDSGLDGVITLGQVARETMTNPAAARKAVATLVEYGLWHAAGHDCDRCPQPPEGAYVFHQWFQFGYSPGDAERTKRDKTKELRDPAVTEAVWARDTDNTGTAHCRYCSKPVRRPDAGKGGDRRSKDIGWLDHVDPTKAIGPTNIVVSCQECNQTKAQRTPEQAGMTLQPPPTDQSGNQSAINTGSIPELCPPRARVRSARGTRAGVGIGEGLGKGSGEGPRAGQGPGPGRAGPAPNVPVASRWPTSPRHPGPPTPQALAATCPDHHLAMPCGKCLHRPEPGPAP